MTNHVLLNSVAHQNLKVVTRHSSEFGDDVNAVVTFPTEYADVQRESPILFRKDQESGEYQSVALLGLNPGENLFLDDNGWHASYVPGIMARGPFLIGFQEQELDGELRKEPVIHVDMDNPRVNETEGEPVFLEHGGNSPYLERMAETLDGIHRGLSHSKPMFAAFESHDLIEPVNIEMEVHGDQKVNLRGFYTINEDKLRELSGDALAELNKAGYLQSAFLVIASLSNVKKLIGMKRKRMLGQQKD